MHALRSNCGLSKSNLLWRDAHRTCSKCCSTGSAVKPGHLRSSAFAEHVLYRRQCDMRFGLESASAGVYPYRVRMQEHAPAALQVGIISPYRGQIQLIKQLLQDIDLRKVVVEVNTIDGFQASLKILDGLSQLGCSKPACGQVTNNACIRASG